MVTYTIPKEIERYLSFIEKKTSMERKILDCGAGGRRPKIAIFRELGFNTTGIEISEKQIENANNYGKQNNLELNILQGDMRNLPFEDNSFSFVYSYHTIMHLRKKDIETSIKEMLRVLKPDGLLYVNFQSIDSTSSSDGEDLGDYEMLERIEVGKHDFEDILHSYHRENEADKYFKGHTIICKGKSEMQYNYQNRDCVSVTIDYIVEKKK